MALVYNSIEVPYGYSVRQSVLIPLYPRLRQYVRSPYNILGLVTESKPIIYDIIDYLVVSQSVEVPYAGSVYASINVPYAQEHRVLQSIAIPYSGLNRVFNSIQATAGIPGYTLVTKSTRVLARFDDQSLIQPSIAIRVTLI
jgi:hypothetical protein